MNLAVATFFDLTTFLRDLIYLFVEVYLEFLAKTFYTIFLDFLSTAIF